MHQPIQGKFFNRCLSTGSERFQKSNGFVGQGDVVIKRTISAFTAGSRILGARVDCDVVFGTGAVTVADSSIGARVGCKSGELRGAVDTVDSRSGTLVIPTEALEGGEEDEVASFWTGRPFRVEGVEGLRCKQPPGTHILPMATKPASTTSNSITPAKPSTIRRLAPNGSDDVATTKFSDCSGNGSTATG